MCVVSSFGCLSCANRWLSRQRSDQYVHRARLNSFRCRSAFKLLQLDERIPGGLLHPGDLVVDCGAAPGSWSQVAASKVGNDGLVLAFDLQPIAPLGNVLCHSNVDIRRDLQWCIAQIEKATHRRGSVDVVLSDMAPNASGKRELDIPAMIQLAQAVLQLALHVSRPGASLVVKLWDSPEAIAYRDSVAEFYPLDQCLNNTKPFVKFIKPPASRSDSSEIYLVARGFCLPS